MEDPLDLLEDDGDGVIVTSGVNTKSPCPCRCNTAAIG